MHRIRAAGLLAALLWGFAAPAAGENRMLELAGAPALPTTEQDDATLFDATFLGNSRAWAVGDRGVVWKSEDSGRTWQFVPLPQAYHGHAFRSVCFLTDRIGWIAGETVLTAGSIAQGVVLFTQDGGASWKRISDVTLPPLRSVQFFGLEEGVVVGARSSRFPTGVIFTEDGGQTWRPAPGSESAEWRAATFTSPAEGLLAGSRGQQGIVSRGAVHSGSGATVSLRAFHAVSADRDGRGWLVGDGATALCRDPGSAAWRPPGSRLPRELEDWCDFYAVAQQGSGVWLAGSPGAVIWHSPDFGETWTPQATGDPAPLLQIRFADDRLGIAVGQFGRIVRTEDGGRTWTVARGGGRRLACLTVTTQARRTDLEFLGRWAREDGYRTAAVVATRADFGPDGHAADGLGERLAQAVRTAGGNHAAIDWRLPLAQPGLERNRERLLEEWTQLTDHRLADVLLGTLTARIRAWRPSILLIEEPDEDNAAADVVRQALLAAVEQAGDPSRFPGQRDLLGLNPWQVSKVVLQRRRGAAGVISLNPYEPLPRQATTLDAVCRAARSQLGFPEPAGHPEYTVVRVADDSRLSDRVIFGDLPIAPGSDARRELAPLRDVDIERLRSEADRRRSLTALGQRLATGADGGAHLIGQLGSMVRSLSPENAALQLAELGRIYRNQGEWANAEAVYLELVSRYPSEPAAVEAMLWLVPFWSSAEMNWQLFRTVSATQSRIQYQGETVQSNVERALEIAGESALQSTKVERLGQLPDAIQQTDASFSPRIVTPASFGAEEASGVGQHQLLLDQSQDLAARSIKLLKQHQPQLFDAPQLQFSTAALMRRRSQPRQADEIYGSFLKSLSDDPWHKAARGETWLLAPGAIQPKPVIYCRRTRTPPFLDGVLSDDCWASAGEVRLSGSGEETSYTGAAGTAGRRGSPVDEPILMFCYDQRFLYVAASVPVDPTLPDVPPQLPGRTHDADLNDFDRLVMQFDIDRDYSTYYQFEVDQRGQTRDSCWGNQDFNPRWYCAAARTASAWRIELAIPLEELLPPENAQAATWAVGLTRIRPGQNAQSWTGSGAEIPQPALFGFLRFE